MIEANGPSTTPKWRGDAEDIVTDLEAYSSRGITCLISSSEQALLLEYIREITKENLRLRGLLKEGHGYIDAMAHGFSVWDLQTAPIRKWLTDTDKVISEPG
jgi:hypothetical protein